MDHKFSAVFLDNSKNVNYNLEILIFQDQDRS